LLPISGGQLYKKQDWCNYYSTVIHTDLTPGKLI
jgi:hypothetical protein